jgi:hypothetical protein
VNRQLSLCTLAALVGLGILATRSYADIPPRPVDAPADKSTTPLVVRVDPNKDVSFLRVPREQLKEAAEAKDAKQGWLPGRTQSMIAAMAASIGVASVFLLRGKRNAKIAVWFVTGLVASAAVAQAWWAPPPGKPFTTPANFSGEVVIEPTDGFQVELIIGTKPLPQRRGRPGPPPEAPREKAT